MRFKQSHLRPGAGRSNRGGHSRRSRAADNDIRISVDWQVAGGLMKPSRSIRYRLPARDRRPPERTRKAGFKKQSAVAGCG